MADSILEALYALIDSHEGHEWFRAAKTVFGKTHEDVSFCVITNGIDGFEDAARSLEHGGTVYPIEYRSLESILEAQGAELRTRKGVADAAKTFADWSKQFPWHKGVFAAGPVEDPVIIVMCKVKERPPELPGWFLHDGWTYPVELYYMPGDIVAASGGLDEGAVITLPDFQGVREAATAMIVTIYGDAVNGVEIVLSDRKYGIQVLSLGVLQEHFSTFEHGGQTYDVTYRLVHSLAH